MDIDKTSQKGVIWHIDKDVICHTDSVLQTTLCNKTKHTPSNIAVYLPPYKLFTEHLWSIPGRVSVTACCRHKNLFLIHFTPNVGYRIKDKTENREN